MPYINFIIQGAITNIDLEFDELLSNNKSERSGRLIDNDQIGSMEKKKSEGYF